MMDNLWKTEPQFITPTGVEVMNVEQGCVGESVGIKDYYVYNFNPCAYLLQVHNLGTDPRTFRFESKELHLNDTIFLAEHVTQSLVFLKSEGEAMFHFAVVEEEAEEVKIEIDAVHGAVSLYVSKWTKPNLTHHDFSSTRCGRIPDLVSFNETQLINVRPEEEVEARNPLIGNYYALVKAYQDSAFNIVYSVKRATSHAAPLELTVDQPYTGVLRNAADYAVFRFTEGISRVDGEDIRVSVVNLSTSHFLKIYVTPYLDGGLPPSETSAYEFTNSHSNYVLLSHTMPELDLSGTFFIRVAYPSMRNDTTSPVRFRIVVMTSGAEEVLRSGESHDGYLEAKSARAGAFFQYLPLNLLDDSMKMTVTLTTLEGGDAQMYISVGDGFPDAANANLGRVKNSKALSTQDLKDANPKCAERIELASLLNDTDSGFLFYLTECAVHVGVFPLRPQE